MADDKLREYVVVPKEPSDADIERMARAICSARQWHEDEFWKVAIPDARAAHSALVRGDG